MAFVLDKTPPAVDQSGTLNVWWFPGTTFPKLADLSGAAVKPLTYSYTPGGWKPTSTQAVKKRGRLTLPQDIESFDKKVKGLTMEYVESVAVDSADAVLQEGLEGFFIERRGIGNTEAPTAAHKFSVWPVQLGEQTAKEPNDGDEWSIVQTARITGEVKTRVTLASA